MPRRHEAPAGAEKKTDLKGDVGPPLRLSRPAGTRIRVCRRLAALLSKLAFHSIRFGSKRLGAMARRRSGKAVFGEALTALFESLGPTFIKIGQILSSRPDLVSPETGLSLRKLQDRVGPFDASLIPEILRDAFGAPMESVFESFQMRPVSSASVAQVHRARLETGEEVAVKIRRPGIMELVEDDLRILSSLAGMIERVPVMRILPLRSIVDQFGSAIEKQLDFRLEAWHNRRFRRNFKEQGRIMIPRLFESLCTDSVLTMEYFDDLTRTENLALSAEDTQQAVRVGLQALYKMIFVDGFVHGDMHPGNVFFQKGPRFVMLDLGLVADLKGKDQTDFVNFFYGMVQNEGWRCAQVIYDTATYRSGDLDRAEFEASIIKLVEEHSSQKAHRFEVSRFAVGLFERQRRFGIRGSTNFMMTILALLVYEGIVKQLYPEMDFQGEARHFINTYGLAPLLPETVEPGPS